MRPIIIVLIYILLSLTSTTAFGNDLNKLLQEHMEYNERNNGSGNYFIYYSPEFATSPTTPLFTTDWLKEDPMGIMPLAQTLRDVLLKYNTETYEDDEINYTGKIQHYVVVIDLTYYNKTLVDVFTQKIKESFGLKGSTKFQDFDTQVKERETEEIKTFPVAATFESNAKFLVTFAFVHKVVVNDIVKAEVRLTYGVSKNYPYEKITKYCAAAREKFNAEKDKPTTKGLNIIITDVYYFIEKIWEDPSPRIACLDQIGEIASTIASEFIEQRCTLAGENTDNKYALLRSAQFIELLRYCKDQSTNSILSNDVIGDISVNYFPWLDLFLLPYFQEPEPKQPYDLWLRDHYKLYQPSNATLNNYHNVYFEYFFVTDQPEYDDLKEILITSLQHYDGVHETPEEILAKFNPFKNWRFNRSFNNVFKWTNTGNYTDPEKAELHSILINYPNIQAILYNWILNPGPGSFEIPVFGPSSVEIARNMIPLIEKFSTNPEPAYDAAHAVPIKFGDALFEGRENYMSALPGFNPSLYNYTFYDRASTALVNSNLEILLELCHGTCVYGFPSTCNCISTLAELPSEVGFFDFVYAVEINSSGYLANCFENEELNIGCRNKISREPAFFTATKIRQGQINEIVHDVSLALGILTLPVSITEFAVAQAGWRIAHGIWIANDVASIIIDQPQFEEVCTDMFGPLDGPEIATRISQVNFVISLTSLADVLNATGKLPEINDQAAIDAAAGERYLRDYNAHTDTEFPFVENEEYIEIGGQIGADKVTGSGAYIEDAIQNGYDDYYRLDRAGIAVAPENENLRKLINKCDRKTSTFDPPPVPGQKRIHHILNDLEPEELDILISDLNGPTGNSLINFFEGAPDIVGIENRLQSWEDLIQYFNLRNSTNTLDALSRWIEDGIEVLFDLTVDGANIISINGDEIGEFVKNGADEFIVLSDDFFKSTGAGKSFGPSIIYSNTDEIYINPQYVLVGDGTIGFLEDVSSYGSTIVQNTIKQRGSLRTQLIGITASQDAHHIIPVQLLKENDVVKAAVEAEFAFNTPFNGLALEKFVKATGNGRHGPHPNYTSQIRNALNAWAAQNPNYSGLQAKAFLEMLTGSIKNTINTTSGKINEINLGL